METTVHCNICGSNEVEIDETKDIGKCNACDAKVILPKNLKNDEIAGLLEQAYIQRNDLNFDLAIKIYKDILKIDSDEIAAYEGLVLSKYGIVYVKDSRSGKMVSTCHRAHFRPIFMDEDYKRWLDLCNNEQKEVLQSRVEEIDRLLKAIERQIWQEEDFDVFISYKSKDDEGNPTQDALIAREIYDELIKRNCRTFSSDKTLGNRIEGEYEPSMFKALHSAKIFVLVGTSKENIYSPWVRNEWSRFIYRIKDSVDSVDATAFIPVFKGMDPNDFPKIRNHSIQGVDASKIGYAILLADGIERLIGPHTDEDADALASESQKRKKQDTKQ